MKVKGKVKMKDPLDELIVTEFELQIGDKKYKIYSRSMDTIHEDFWRELKYGEIRPARYIGKLIRVRERPKGKWHYISSEAFIENIEKFVKYKRRDLKPEGGQT